MLYFAAWPGNLYAFDGSNNEVRWKSPLDLSIDEVNQTCLPAPAPELKETYVLVHLGRRLWGVSKVDGRSVWSAEGLPDSSRENLRTSSNPLSGYFSLGEDTSAGVVTLEEDSDGWLCRRRRLGDGSLEWEFALEGDPKGWWLDLRQIWIVCQGSAATAGSGPGVLLKLNADSGEVEWTTPVSGDTRFLATLRATRRVFLLEERAEGKFEIRAFNEESGDLYRSAGYSDGDFVGAFQTEDKLLFLHRQESSKREVLGLRMYYSSLNPMLARPTVLYPHDEKLFAEPVLDRTLLLYAGTAYSVFTGHPVWQEEVGQSLVDWVSDEDHIYLWDSAGELICLDRLAGQERWRTAFEPLQDESIGPNHGSASLALSDGRLVASTPYGELVKMDAASGALHPEVLRLRPATGGDQSAVGGGGKRPSGLWLWAVLALIVIVAAGWITASSRRRLSDSGGEDDGWM
jgi:outer membrane protein assembly factor BamB